jgi:hypothetical protein
MPLPWAFLLMTKIQTMKPIEDELAPFPFGAGLVEAIGELEDLLASLRVLSWAVTAQSPLRGSRWAQSASRSGAPASAGLAFTRSLPTEFSWSTRLPAFRGWRCEAARLRDSVCERAGIQNAQGSSLCH